MTAYELNLDGLVGPTHHYAGLSFGNLASTANARIHASPRQAALQGLEKMRFLYELGIKQAILPPHYRPNLRLLQQLGFKGSPSEQIQAAFKKAPDLLSACYSASSMWAANMATVSASSDCNNHKVNFTAANLLYNLHRHQEAAFSQILLEKIFQNHDHFEHHPILPQSLVTSDEGAANHSRLCKKHDQKGIYLFVYGKEGLQKQTRSENPLKFPARQSLEASEAVARAHGIDANRVIFARQNPEAIDQGVFHNDVIAVANESLLFIHEEAFYQQKKIYATLQKKADFNIQIIEINKKQLSVKEAVQTYLFNSQLLSLPKDRGMLLLAPIECQESKSVQKIIDEFIHDPDNPIQSVHYINLKQSMQNGGGPACLRLRVLLNEQELRAMHQAVLINEELLIKLEHWVKKHYRSQLNLEDLADPVLMEESMTALDALSDILKLGSIYPFQK